MNEEHLSKFFRYCMEEKQRIREQLFYNESGLYTGKPYRNTPTTWKHVYETTGWKPEGLKQ